jgi:hypothetical protein
MKNIERADQEAFMRARRRAERGHFRALVSDQQPTRRENELFQRKVLIAGFIAVLTVILFVLIIGFYLNNVQPPGRVVGRVGDQEITLRELVPLTRAYAAEAGASSADFNAQDIKTADILNIMIRNEILRKQTPQLGVQVSAIDVELELVRRFEVPFREAFAPTPTELGPQGQALLDKFLTERDLTESSYRSWIEGTLRQQETLGWFVSAQPSEAEQVYVKWIIAATPEGAQRAKDRLDQGDPFEDVASDLNIDNEYADQNGLVGWLPRGIVPELDEAMFSATKGSTVGPIATSVGGIVVVIEDGPKFQPLAEYFLSILSIRAAEEWYREQLIILDIAHNFDDDDIDWLIGQVG